MIELSGADYDVVVAISAVVFTTAAVVAQRRAGAGALNVVTGIAATILSVLGYLDWYRLESKETPLIAYALTAVLPPLIAALLIYRLRRQALAVQWLVGTASFCITFIPALVISVVFPI